ncbi:MAG: 4'-phosphopantetheinyl transferase superfamily protein [Paludibacteraceae bacterium]|nr:4'-phosphopantetheinyl transferase superfamily protein [Paludibacteraceae bacterium]
MQIEIFDNMAQCTEAEVQRMLPLVSAQRREQALRYKHTFGQFCCLKSWLMLDGLLKTSMKYRQNPDEIPINKHKFIYNEHGKPLLPNGPYFSISHCKSGIAVAVDEQPIGIDIETIRHADRELIERTMNAKEQKRIQTDRDFTRLWTQKEAVGKAIGTGLQSFEQIQTILQNDEWNVQTVENENYIYSIAYGKLHCFGAEV